MTLAQDFEDFVKLLNKHQVDYNKPRHTGDLDITVQEFIVQLPSSISASNSPASHPQ